MRTLKISMYGDDVLAWQVFLKNLGLYTAKLDKDFGGKTLAATQAFQQMNAIPVTGEVDDQTLDRAVEKGFQVTLTIESVGTVGSVEVKRINGACFYLSELTIDADGAYHAYHPRGTGLDYTANGGKPGNWWALVTDNGKPSGKPVVQSNNDPAPGYYISTTSLEDTTRPRTDPRRYVDSESVPYFVLPPQIRDACGAVLGDMGIVMNVKTGQWTAAIFADIGPKKHIGEASMQTAGRLDINPSPKIGGTETKKIMYIVFPKSGNGKPRSVAEIEEIGGKLFDAWGGTDMVKRLL